MAGENQTSWSGRAKVRGDEPRTVQVLFLHMPKGLRHTEHDVKDQMNPINQNPPKASANDLA